MRRTIAAAVMMILVGIGGAAVVYPQGETQEYRLLATKKTSTMEKEMNAAAAEGFKFGGVMGGNTAAAGSEVVVIMTRKGDSKGAQRYQYKLLATTKTSTMQKEIQMAGDEGFQYCGQTIFETTFGGKEVVCILERDRQVEPVKYEYRLLATSKTSTMQKELTAAGLEGFGFVGVTVAETAMGGAEVVCILRRAGR